MTTQTSIERAREEFLVIMGKAAGPTRFTEPRCADEQADGVCKCPQTTHTVDTRFHDTGVSRPACGVYDGWVRRRDGSVWLRPHPSTPAKPTKIPKRTIENMAAASALGLAYWSEAPGANKIYAVDNDGHAHTLLLDRKAFKVEHYCHQTWRFDPHAGGPRHETKRHCPVTDIRDVSWSMPEDDQAVMELNWTIEDASPGHPERDPLGWGMTGHCLSGRHRNCAHRVGGLQEHGVVSNGVTYRCPCPCHTTEETEMPTPTPASDKAVAKKAAAKKRTPVSMGGLTAAERRAQKEGRERRQAERDAEYARRDAEIEAEVRADAEARDKAEALVKAATPPAMGRAQARALLLHDPDYLGDIPNAALVDLLDDESVKPYHARIRTELRVNRGLTQRKSA